ncbi:MAG: hypothetical protein GY749_44785, partial [Desulfobacteraceae bacterium]|nr:hypothetical protein [Desulfobacteraceae bacterium]
MKNGEPFEIFTKIQNFDEYRLQVVTYFKVSHMNLSLSWAGNDPLKDHIYYCKESEENLEGSFQGILPMNFKHIDRPKGFNYASYLDIVPKLFEEYFKPINYLGPFRKEPKRAYLFPGGVKRNVGFGGEKAPELLGDDFLRRKGKVLSAVSDWFSKHLGGWPLDLSSHGDTFSLVLRNPENPSVEVNIADVGTGIA